MGRKRNPEAGSKEPGLKLVENGKAVEWVDFECPLGHQQRMESEVNPLCSKCNWTRKMKPRRTCPACEGTGKKTPGGHIKCLRCMGIGTLAPEFTPEESR